MLIDEQYVEVGWNSKNTNHYKSLGYKFTKFGDKITVPAKDLTIGSNVKVKVSCDYCGCVREITYAKHIKFGDTCAKCSPIKVRETNNALYGVDNAFQREEVKQKSVETIRNKYGVDNVQQCDEIHRKTQETVKKLYGVDNLFQSEEIKEKARQTLFKNYGVYHTSQSVEIMEKARETLLKNNGEIWVSRPEEATINLLESIYGKENCQRQYHNEYYYLDCLLTINEVKIDFEYDCKYFHEKQKAHDNKRDGYHISNGYKILRIKAGKNIPSADQIELSVYKLLYTDSKYEEIVLKR